MPVHPKLLLRSALVAAATAFVPSGVTAQPGPVEHVSVRAELVIEDAVTRASREDWMVRHNGPWLKANDEWTNAAGVTYFPANTEYWIVAVVDECAGCSFELRFFDEAAGGYFPLTEILDVDSDGSVMTASGRFAVDQDTRGELYLQMEDGRLYPSYVLLAQVR